MIETTPDTTLRSVRSRVEEAHLRMSAQFGELVDRAPRWTATDREQLWAAMHVTCVEDTAVSLLIEARKPLFQNIWANGHVLPTEPARAREYMTAVHASTDTLLGSLSDADLERLIDLSSEGLGRVTLAWVLDAFLVNCRE